MVLMFFLSVEAAVRAFAQARPPGIYKEDYLHELFSRYGDPDDTPPPPALPDWCSGIKFTTLFICKYRLIVIY